MFLNRAVIIGNITQDPELRTTPGGQQVATFTIATNRTYTERDSKTKKEVAEFHNIVAWGKLAEIIGSYVKKGRLIMIEGRLQTRSWDGQDGVKRYRTEIIAENMQMGPRPGGAGGNDYVAPASTTASGSSTAPSNAAPLPEDEIKVEDIPF